MTADQINTRICEVVMITAPERIRELPHALSPYVMLLKENLEKCCVGRGEVFPCNECVRATAVLSETETVIRSISEKAAEDPGAGA
jgi:hypothetical protein